MVPGLSDNLKFEHLKESNYYGWKTNMEAALKLKDLWGPVVESEAWTNLEESAKEIADDKARSLMLLCISTSLKTLISECTTAKDAWSTLEEIFHARSAGRKFSLRATLHDLKRKKSEGVLEFVARAEKLRTELREACNEDVSEDVMVHVILSGLGKAYETFVKMTKFSHESLTLSQLKARLLNVESEVKNADSVDDEATVLATKAMQSFQKKNQKEQFKAKKKAKDKCHNCGKTGHWKRECPELKSAKAVDTAVAFVCQKVGDMAEDSRLGNIMSPDRYPGSPIRRPVYDRLMGVNPNYWCLSDPNPPQDQGNRGSSPVNDSPRYSEEYGRAGTSRQQARSIQTVLSPESEMRDSLEELVRVPTGATGRPVQERAGAREYEAFLARGNEDSEELRSDDSGEEEKDEDNVVPMEDSDDENDPDWLPIAPKYVPEEPVTVRSRRHYLIQEPGYELNETKGAFVAGPNCNAVACKVPFEVGVGSDEDEMSMLQYLLIDSGASHHVIKDRELFDLGDFKYASDYTASTGQAVNVQVGGGELHRVVGWGSVLLVTSVEGQDQAIMLKGALYVPSMKHNIFSVRQALAKGAVTVFADDQVVVLIKGKTVFKASMLEGLFVAPIVTLQGYSVMLQPHQSHESFAKSASAHVYVVSVERWHQRLGHPSMSTVRSMMLNKTAIGLSDSGVANHPSGKCIVCLQAKQRRVSFQLSDSCATEMLALIHADTMGPIQPKSAGGARFVLVVLDDYSRYSEVRLLESKAEIGDKLLDVIELWERQTGKLVKILRTDRGTEFCNSALDDILRSKGIVHQLSVRYTPEQNGRVERVNRTLMERTRALILEAGVPKRLWGEALVTANRLKNIVPAAKAKLSPFELFYRKQPDVSMLRVWGSTAYVHVPKQLRGKLDPRSEIGMLVGYAKNSKAWRIAIKKNNGALEVVERVDVVFDEDRLGCLTKGSGKNDTELVDVGITLDSAGKYDDTAEEAELAVPVAAEIPETGEHSESSVQHYADQEVPEANEILEEEEEECNDQGLTEDVTDEAHEQPQVHEQLRRSSRASAKPWKPYDGYVNVAALSDEPQSVAEVKKRPDRLKWEAAIDTELTALKETEAYEEVELPEGRKPLPTKWVFKKKRDEEGEVDVYRARLTVKGFHQKAGVDFDEIFAPVSKLATLRTMLSVVCDLDIELHQMDVRTAFLNASLEEEVYVKPPEGARTSNLVWRLKKAMNGLKQSPRAWYKNLRETLKQMGFEPSTADNSLYISDQFDGRAFVLVYVDDLLIAGSKHGVDAIKRKIQQAYKVKDVGEAKFFLGMSIVREREERKLWIGQPAYAKDVLERYGMSDSKPRRTPLDAHLQLSKNTKEPEAEVLEKYQEIVGSLLYLSNCTRPDMAHSVGMLARFMSAPADEHLKAAKQVLRYLSGSIDIGIEYQAEGSMVLGYSDADYAGDPDKRKSTSGYAFLMNGGVISWSSKLQSTVAASTCESEFIAASAAAKEALWLKMLMADITGQQQKICIKVDNQGALKLLHHPHAHQRTKHIDVAYRFVQDRVERGELDTNYVRTSDMVADCLTKAVVLSQFVKNKQQMGLKSKDE